VTGLLLSVALALAAPKPAPDAHPGGKGLASLFDLGLHVPKGAYEGPFARPPVAQWQVRLPGPPLNAAVHTERTRPVVHGDDIFVGSAEGRSLYRLARRDGSLEQAYPASASVESEPIITGDRVYFTDTGGSTWCYTLKGEQVWRHEGKAPILVRPTLDGGRVYVTNVDDLAVALDADSGELVWQYQRPPDVTRETELALYGAPPAVVVDDEVILGFSDGAVAAVDAKTGALQWDRQVGEGRYPDVVAAPTAWGNDIFASGYFKPFVAIDRSTHNVRWRLEYGAANASLLASVNKEPVLFDPGTDGVLHAVVARTGDDMWSWDSGSAGALTTPVITDAGLLVSSSDAGVYLVDPRTGKEIWRYHEPVRLLGVSSSPTVAGRQMLFVSNAGYLYGMIAPSPDRYEPDTPYPSWH